MNKNILYWIPLFGMFWLIYVTDWGRYHWVYYVGIFFWVYQAMTTSTVCIILLESIK